MLRRRESRFRLIVIKTASLSLWVGSERTAATAGLIIRQGRVASRSLLLSTTEGKPQKQQRITYIWKGLWKLVIPFHLLLLLRSRRPFCSQWDTSAAGSCSTQVRRWWMSIIIIKTRRRKQKRNQRQRWHRPCYRQAREGGLERKVDNVRPLVIAIYLSVSIVCVMCSAVFVCRRA